MEKNSRDKIVYSFLVGFVFILILSAASLLGTLAPSDPVISSGNYISFLGIVPSVISLFLVFYISITLTRGRRREDLGLHFIKKKMEKIRSELDRLVHLFNNSPELIEVNYLLKTITHEYNQLQKIEDKSGIVLLSKLEVDLSDANLETIRVLCTSSTEDLKNYGINFNSRLEISNNVITCSKERKFDIMTTTVIFSDQLNLQLFQDF